MHSMAIIYSPHYKCASDTKYRWYKEIAFYVWKIISSHFLEVYSALVHGGMEQTKQTQNSVSAAQS